MGIARGGGSPRPWWSESRQKSQVPGREQDSAHEQLLIPNPIDNFGRTLNGIEPPPADWCTARQSPPWSPPPGAVAGPASGGSGSGSDGGRPRPWWSEPVQ